MAHYAKIENGIVTQVVVAEQDFTNLISNENDLWIQTSYNTRGGVHYKPNTNEPSEDQSKALRKNYGGKGCMYDYTNDAFYSPKPFDSWTLNEETFLWESPVAYPTDGGDYTWNEETQAWVEITE